MLFLYTVISTQSRLQHTAATKSNQALAVLNDSVSVKKKMHSTWFMVSSQEA